jgi:tRNA dimethylallyltransferase
MSKITIITGQTATGKTELALKLAAEQKWKLLNSDSRQIYKYLDIISGKDLTNNVYTEKEKLGNFSIGTYTFDTPTKPQLWLYDIISPKDYFSSFDYQTVALHLLKTILKKNSSAIIVGGTYFYLYHLLYNVETETIKPDWELRKRLETFSVEKLQTELQKVNPLLFSELNESEQANPQRLIRKIEISLQKKNYSQKKLQSTITLQKKLEQDIELEYLGLRYKDRDAEYKSIEKRVAKRMNEGAVEEVEQLLNRGFSAENPGMKTIGYQQMIKYLHGDYSKEEMIKDWLTKEMQYAKRQFTFMKKDKNIVWREV